MDMRSASNGPALFHASPDACPLAAEPLACALTRHVDERIERSRVRDFDRCTALHSSTRPRAAAQPLPAPASPRRIGRAASSRRLQRGTMAQPSSRLPPSYTGDAGSPPPCAPPDQCDLTRTDSARIISRVTTRDLRVPVLILTSVRRPPRVHTDVEALATLACLDVGRLPPQHRRHGRDGQASAIRHPRRCVLLNLISLISSAPCCSFWRRSRRSGSSRSRRSSCRCCGRTHGSRGSGRS